MLAKILVVDDEAGFRALLGWQLARLGYHIETVPDGDQAIRLLSHTRFDVVITDMTMPRRHGLAVLEAARRHTQTRVIVMTGFGTVENAVDAMKLGAIDFLLKPFHLRTLINAVTSALRKPPDLRSV